MTKVFYNTLSENRVFVTRQLLGRKYAILSQIYNSLTTSRLQKPLIPLCFAVPSLRRKDETFTP